MEIMSKSTFKNKGISKIKSKNSSVEEYCIRKSEKKTIYKPTEKIPVVHASNFPQLGKLTTLRFIEWVQNNPNVIVPLPTRKTSEYFIKWVKKILGEWNISFVQKILKDSGSDNTKNPKLNKLTFVQIDESYTNEYAQHNSFYHYIKKYYLQNLGFHVNKAFLMNINEIPTQGYDLHQGINIR